MKKILFPTDFSATAENAIRYVLQFCDRLEGSIQLLNVVPPEYEPADIPLTTTAVTQDRIDNARNHSKNFLEQGLAQLQVNHNFQSVPDVISNIELGLPVSTIAEIADRDDIDLIVMGTQGQHSRLERFFGSVSAGVIDKSHIPVLVVPEGAEFSQVNKLAIAIDLKESDPWEIYLASSLAGKDLQHVDCVHVRLDDKDDKTEIDIDQLKAFYKANPQPFTMDFHHVSGENIHSALNAFVEDQEPDVLVMVGPHLPAFKKLFLKSETKQMAYHSKVPLLVLK
ncbi:MAG: universal stress protein [Saprospiraceae bacterium]|nr:universal stress protein [Saprospiraceae bacterium]